jgi:hypothetical protein
MTRFLTLAFAFCFALSGCSKQSERERIEKEIAVARDSLKFYQAEFKNVLDTVRDPNVVREDCSLVIVPCSPGLPRIVSGKDSGSCVSGGCGPVLPKLKKHQEYLHSQSVYISSRANVERARSVFDSLNKELKKLPPETE